MLDYINKDRFQFQYGSIKSLNDAINTKLRTLFQFQYGSIKRFTKVPM